MSTTFFGYRSTETDATGANSNSIYASPFTIDNTATQYSFTVSDGSDPDVMYGDGSGDAPTDPSQVLESTTAPGVNTGNEIIYEAVVKFNGSDGNTYTAIIFDYNEDGDARIENNNSRGLNDNGLYEEGFAIVFINNNFNGTTNTWINPGPVPAPGVTLTRTEETLNNAQFDTFVCFAAGTHICTPNGDVLVDDLSDGDLVMTMDNGPQEIRLIMGRRIYADWALAPIVISKGALGNTQELRVSPEHRMLVSDEKAQLMFGEDKILVPAKCLVNGDTIYQAKPGYVKYFHILLDAHEVIFAENAPSESLQLDQGAMTMLDEAAVQEVFKIFPELEYQMEDWPAARTILKNTEASLLV